MDDGPSAGQRVLVPIVSSVCPSISPSFHHANAAFHHANAAAPPPLLQSPPRRMSTSNRMSQGRSSGTNGGRVESGSSFHMTTASRGIDLR